MKRLVALHGFTGRGGDYDRLADELPGEIKVVAPDWPGHGAKGGLRDKDAYSLAGHLRVIDAAAEDGPIDLLGYSMGGRIALHWALANPARVSRLILIGASPGLRSPSERDERTAADSALAEFIRTRGTDAFIRYWHTQTMFRTLLSMQDESTRTIVAGRHRNDAEGLALSLEHVGTGALPSLWERLPELRMPVDLVTGSEDAKFCAIARTMTTLMPRARYGEVDGAGHAVHLERAGDLAAVILRR
ncbi:MAG: 2-succinyl-6-hydroxy-2,4-cyclohexadiene-1-carboxylate synthase [Opitutia bacterium]